MHDPAGDTPVRHAGTLVLVAGPSGAGKDTLLRAAAVRLCPSRYILVRRDITRPPNDDTEQFRSVSAQEFAAKRAAGDYLLAWDAHGLSYGVPGHYADDLNAGRAVLANVSRTVLAEAAARFAPVQAILVTAPPELLEQRLRMRGREDEAAVRRRLARADYPLPIPATDVLAFVNDLPFAAAVDAFVRLLQTLPSSKATSA